MFDFSAYSAVLLDLDGTVYHEDRPLEGAIEFVRHLVDSQTNFACLSNGTISPAMASRRLANMGVHVSSQRIYTAAAAAADYVLHKFKLGRPARIFNLATEGIQELLEGKVDWVTDDPQPCDAVIIGALANPFVNETRQRIALRLLRAGALAIAICADRIYPSPRGLEFGSGAHSAMLAYAANVKPVYCGKPEPFFFQELCDRINVDPKDCILIGDNLEADIGGAKNMGMKTILTLTGIVRREDLERLPENLHPDYVVGNLRELI